MGFDTRNWLQRWWDKSGRRWLNPWGEAARQRALFGESQRLRNEESIEAARRVLAAERACGGPRCSVCGGEVTNRYSPGGGAECANNFEHNWRSGRPYNSEDHP